MTLDVRDKRVTVVGFGRSGLAAARVLAQRQAHVTITDQRPSAELESSLAELKHLNIRYFMGGHPPEAFQDTDLIVISPGVPMDRLAEIKGVRTGGIPVVGEMELAFSFIGAPLVAITGTNGKSTTTALSGRILKEAGFNVFVGGNLGKPLCEAVSDRERKQDWDWAVVEASSFQLETIHEFRPRVAVLLNVTPNHLDRYRSMDEYTEAKLRLFENQREEDAAVLCKDDPNVMKLTGSLRARKFFVSRNRMTEKGVYLTSGVIESSIPPVDRGKIFRQEEILLRGAHNLENVLAASAVGLICGCPAESVRKAVKSFRGLEHRLEAVRERDGVLYINDSKATTVAALGRALESFTKPIVLIAGGRSKGGEFSVLRNLVAQRVKAVVLMGEAREELRSAWKGVTSLFEAEDMLEAVRLAAQSAKQGDVVLMAPACSSLDMFRNFEDRGQQFKDTVNRL